MPRLRHAQAEACQITGALVFPSTCCHWSGWHRGNSTLCSAWQSSGMSCATAWLTCPAGKPETHLHTFWVAFWAPARHDPTHAELPAASVCIGPSCKHESRARWWGDSQRLGSQVTRLAVQHELRHCSPAGAHICTHRHTHTDAHACICVEPTREFMHASIMCACLGARTRMFGFAERRETLSSTAKLLHVACVHMV